MSKNKKATPPKIEPQQAAAEPVVEQAAPAAPKPAAGRFVVAWGIKVNGTRYGEGDEIQLSAQEAAPFIESGAIAAKE